MDVVEEVWQEIERYAPAVLADVRLLRVPARARFSERLAAFSLDSGERSALSHALVGRPSTAPLFSPREAEEERRARYHSARTTQLSCGNRPGSKRRTSPKRSLGEAYTSSSYARAITRVCKKAGVPHWHPHQLRHSAATEIRKTFGIEVARIVLGHRSLNVTEIYAEADNRLALEAIEQVG
jgi:hypothetical protein